MKKTSPSARGTRFFAKRRAAACVTSERTSGTKKATKSANVKYLTANNVILAVSSDCQQYTFSIAKVKGYAGQDPGKFGLKVGADVRLNLEQGEVREVEITE